MLKDPFERLVDIERKSQRCAEKIPVLTVKEKDWAGVGFKVSGLRFVCPLNEVSEMLNWPTTITGIPNACPWFLGLINVRESILPITDLAGLVLGKVHHLGVQSRILVIHSEGSNFGFAVEEVLGIESFFKTDLKPIDNSLAQSLFGPYSLGTFGQSPKIPILSLQKITQRSGFFHIIERREVPR